jgi:hypothetical protein
MYGWLHWKLARINEDSLDTLFPRLMDPIDDGALVVRLKSHNVDVVFGSGLFRQDMDIVECLAAVD